MPVFLFRDAVVKLDRGSGAPTGFAIERSTLKALAHLSWVPRVLGEGELDGWCYLVQSRARGAPLEERLAELTNAHAAMQQLGEVVRAVHESDPHELTPALPDFDAFLTRQERDIVDIERARGAREAWLEPLRRFVDDTPRGDTRPVLLHTELGPGHALLDDELCLIDWAETLVGDAEYDFAAVAFFIARGDGALLGAFLDGYGWSGPRGEELARRLLRYLLLHRYAPLEWLLERRGVPGATRFEELVEPWMGFAPA